MPENAWVFDTGPLRHFADQGWLGVLKFLAGDRPVYIPDSVEVELHEAVEYVPAVRAVLEADWINVYSIVDLDLSRAFSRYVDLLVAGGKNRGECGVLAIGELYKCEVVIDDSTAFAIAEEKRIRVTATVPLLCEAIRAKKLTTLMVESLADDLLASEYYLPFEPGGFRRHVLENGLLDYDEI